MIFGRAGVGGGGHHLHRRPDRAARIISPRYYSPFGAFLTAGLLYMLLTFAIVWLFKKWEARWRAHLRPRSV